MENLVALVRFFRKTASAAHVCCRVSLPTQVLSIGTIASVRPNEVGSAGVVRNALGIASALQGEGGTAIVSPCEWEIARVSWSAMSSANVSWNEVNASAPRGDVAPRLSVRDRHVVLDPLAGLLLEPVGARFDSACEVLPVQVFRTRPAPSRSARCRASQERRLLWVFSHAIGPQWAT